MSTHKSTITEKHPLWLRWVHWLNIPLFCLMAWSGLLIYWSNDVYPGFFPDEFYSALHINGRLAEGLSIHFSIGWLFVTNALAYLLFLGVSGHWRELFPDRKAWRDLFPTVLHDLRLRKKGPAHGKFNAAQRVTYTGVIGLGLIEILSGFAIYKPVQLQWLTAALGGYENARLIHFVGWGAFLLFTLVHVAQVARAGWNNFRAMVAGFEIKKHE